MESRRQKRLDKRKNAKELRKRKLRELGKDAARKSAAILVAFAMILGAILTASPKPAQAHATNPAVYAGSYGSSIVETARSYYGTPYVYNGYWWADAGIDCSELVMLTYGAHGKYLPDDPYALMRYGYRVSTPEAGDLVFFSEDYSGYPTHVGIATGRGTIIHASSYAGYVTETPIHYLDGYMGARRL